MNYGRHSRVGGNPPAIRGTVKRQGDPRLRGDDGVSIFFRIFAEN